MHIITELSQHTSLPPDTKAAPLHTVFLFERVESPDERIRDLCVPVCNHQNVGFFHEVNLRERVVNNRAERCSAPCCPTEHEVKQTFIVCPILLQVDALLHDRVEQVDVRRTFLL